MRENPYININLFPLFFFFAYSLYNSINHQFFQISICIDPRFHFGRISFQMSNNTIRENVANFVSQFDKASAQRVFV